MRKKTKFLALRAVVILVFAILAGRVWYVQVVMGSYYRAQGDTSKIRLEPVAAMRGIIYDRNGVPLVYNAPSWTVAIVPHGVPRRGAWTMYRQLSRLLNGDPTPDRIAATVAANEWRAYAPIAIKQKVSFDTAMIIRQLHRELPGVQAEPTSIRQYVVDGAGTDALSHTMGYAGIITADQYKREHQMYPREKIGLTDQAGQAGIELTMEPYLHGVNGTEQVEVDAGERPVKVLQKGHTIPGDNVYLTIDWKLEQQIAADLQAALQRIQVRQGVAVVEDVNTGQILAMVSLPSYDNNWFAGGISQQRYGTLLHAPGQPLNDLATMGAFPPGSTFKVITAAAALQTGAVTADTTVDDTGEIQLEGHTFYGWKAGGLGTVSMLEALALSSDIYFYTVAGGNPNLGNIPHAGATAVARYARLFGLGQPTGIELPLEASGFVPSPAWYDSPSLLGSLIRPDASYTWHVGDTYNMAIGQGYNLATPLQMANVAATIANGGTLYQPHIVDRIVGRVVPRRGVLPRNQVVQPFVPTMIRRNFVDSGNLQLIRDGMHQGVAACNWNGGTSYYVCDRRIDAAGKTGTAEVQGQAPHAWWIGFAPYNHPKISVAVLIPSANSEGAYAAAPLAHKIFEDYFHLTPQLPDRPGDTNWLDDESAQLVGSGGAQ